MVKTYRQKMSDEPAHPRYRGPDVLKGFIIFAIVMIHIVMNSGQTMGPGEPMLILQILYLGLMSFFIISGYFYRPGTGFVHNIKKRISQILVALILCSFIIPIILWIWLSILGYQLDLGDYIDAVRSGFWLNNMFITPEAYHYHPYCCGFVGYYFLWIMMWAFIVFYAVIEHVIDDLRKVIAVIIVLLVVELLLCMLTDVNFPMGFKEVPMGAAFMFLGHILSRHSLIENIEKMELRTKRFWLPFLMCLALGVVLCLVVHPGLRFDAARFGNIGPASVFTFFVEGGCMCVVYIYLAAFVARIPVLSNGLEICGHHTMGILLYHGSVATAIFALIAPLTYDAWFPTVDFTTRLAIAIATLLICLAICIYGPKLISAIRDRKKDGRGGNPAIQDRK